jgi:hypothetical protein
VKTIQIANLVPIPWHGNARIAECKYPKWVPSRGPSDELRARKDPRFSKARCLYLLIAAVGAAGAYWYAFICGNNSFAEIIRNPKFTQLSHSIARELRKQQANLECEIAELEQA